jgi:DNA-binding CsgD family transcriptional regulator/nucleoside-triphosphatase THEP1
VAFEVDRPLTCPVLIGRAVPLEALDVLIDQTRAGTGATVLVSGEAGIGKTRLLERVRQRAEELNLQVLSSRCFEADRVIAYAPLVDLLPQLRQSQFASASDGGGESPEVRKRRRTQAITQRIMQQAQERAMLVVFEDVHWSDQASLEVMQELARSTRSMPLLLVVTYRADEVNPDLRQMLAAFDRERLAVGVHLRRLDASQVGAMLRATLGLDRPVRPDLVELVAGLTDGNPFFVEEVLRAQRAAGDLALVNGQWTWSAEGRVHVPRTVHDAVQRQTQQLGETPRRVLELAAVAGRQFDFELIVELSGRGEDEVLVALKALIAAGLVVEESADLFTFRHALTRQAVMQGLLARERRELHLRVAQTLERRHADESGWLDERAGDLASHYAHAEEWAAAFEYARIAGERALGLYAPQTAIEQLTRAIDAARRLGVQVPWQVYRGRGHAFEIRGAFDEARADLEAALDAARARNDRQAAWQTLLDLGQLWSARDYAQARRYFQAALDQARDLPDSLAIARSLNRLGNCRANQDEPLQAQADHQEALAIFEQLGAQAEIAQTLDLLAMATHLAGDDALAARRWRQAVDAFRVVGDRAGLSSSLAALAVLASEYTAAVQPVDVHPREAVRYADEAFEIARGIGWQPGQAFAAIVRFNALAALGEYRRISSSIDDLGLADELEHRQWITAAQHALGCLHLDLLDLTTARRHFERGLALAREMGSGVWVGTVASGLAGALAQNNEGERAEVLLDELAAPPPQRTAASANVQRTRGEVALLRGAPELALAIADEFLALDAQRNGPPAVMPRLLKLRGEALVALGRPEDGASALAQAREEAALHGRRPLLWRIDAALGRALQEQHRLAEAEAAFNRARECVHELAEEIADESLRAIFLAGVARELPAARPLTPRRAAKQQFGGLTEREREVATLIVRGSSNRQIAERLVLSERTVESHVRNILDRLELSSRTQIAVWGQAHGLGSQSD